MGRKQETLILFIIAALGLSACHGPSATVAGTETAHVEARETGQELTAQGEAAAQTQDAAPVQKEEASPKKEPLTMEKVLELAGKEELGWEDFEGYASEDVGSGLMILHYGIDDNFSVVIGGSGVDKPPRYIRLVSGFGEEFVELPADSVEAFIQEHSAVREYVGIKGHIKESYGGRALIVSDTDGFPGVFDVRGVDALAEPEELKGGACVFVVMYDLKKAGRDGLSMYQAKKVMAWPEDEERAEISILLTDAPPFALTDTLSSKCGSFEIQSGNYTWNWVENGVGTGIAACGAAPLDEASTGTAARLKLPRYQGADCAPYIFSTKIQPDKLVIRQWPAGERGDFQAEEESVTTYYSVMPFLELKPGKLYEFAAEWKKEEEERRKFSGMASYVLVTE